MLYPGFFLVGGLSLPLYALCVAHTNDFLNSEQMVGASSALVLAFGIGAAAGPTAHGIEHAGDRTDRASRSSWRWCTWCWACSRIWRMTRRSTVPAGDRGAYMSLPTPSPVVIPMAQEKAVAQSPSPPPRPRRRWRMPAEKRPVAAEFLPSRLVGNGVIIHAVDEHRPGSTPPTCCFCSTARDLRPSQQAPIRQPWFSPLGVGCPGRAQWHAAGGPGQSKR